MNTNEFKRCLAKQDATVVQGKGSRINVFLDGRPLVLPMHAADLKAGTVEAIKK